MAESTVRLHNLRRFLTTILRRASHRSKNSRILRDRAQLHLKRRGITAFTLWHSKVLCFKRKGKVCDIARLRLQFKRFALHLRARRQVAYQTDLKLKRYAMVEWSRYIHMKRNLKFAFNELLMASLKQGARRQLWRWFRIARARSILTSRKLRAADFYRHRRMFLAFNYLRSWI